ncbi:MarR family transcriptional regulator [Micromonospora sp. CPCC 205371]|nr:MarR family transcriptional regulator [Micromonospora sp. CPCC 205371]
MKLARLDDVPLGRLVAIAGRLAAQRWQQLLTEEFDLTPSGMSVVMTLLREGELPHGQVAGHCMVRPATLTGIVDTLEKSGYVERRRNTGDRRGVTLALTEHGVERGRQLVAYIHRGSPLTSVDADPAKAAVVREFLLELISKLHTGEESDERSR